MLDDCICSTLDGKYSTPSGAPDLLDRMQYTQARLLMNMMASAVHLMVNPVHRLANTVHSSEAPEVQHGLHSTLDGKSSALKRGS